LNFNLKVKEKKIEELNGQLYFYKDLINELEKSRVILSKKLVAKGEKILQL